MAYSFPAGQAIRTPLGTSDKGFAVPCGPLSSESAGEEWIPTYLLLLALCSELSLPQVSSWLHSSTVASLGLAGGSAIVSPCASSFPLPASEIPSALFHPSLGDVLLLEKSNWLDGDLLCSIVQRKDFHIILFRERIFISVLVKAVEGYY